MNKISRSLSKKPQFHLIPDSHQITLVECCSFNLPEEWKIISKTMQRPTRKFINLTIGDKKFSQSSSRQIQSKETRSRQLSHQSSRELFEKVKKDFIQQLKLWKQDDGKFLQNQRPKTSRVNVGGYQEQDNYFEINPENQRPEIDFYAKEGEQQVEGSNNRSMKWMDGLNSIEQVGVNFQTSEGLLTQNSGIFQGLNQNK